MPLTPNFTLSQTPSTLTVTINVPHVRVSSTSTEIIIDGSTLHFYAPPYLLRLELPGRLVDDESLAGGGGGGGGGGSNDKEARVIYDMEKNGGTITIVAHKELELVEEGKEGGGVMWPDLDLIGRLLVRPSPAPSRGGGGDDDDGGGPMVTVLDSSEPSSTTTTTTTGADAANAADADSDGGDRDEDDERRVEEGGGGAAAATAMASTAASAPAATNEDPLNDLLSLTKPRYGFLNLYHSAFQAYSSDGLLLSEMLELPDPDTTPAHERRGMRLEFEQTKFDVERYLGDLWLGMGEEEEEEEEEGMKDPVFAEAMGMVPHWMVGAEDGYGYGYDDGGGGGGGAECEESQEAATATASSSSSSTEEEEELIRDFTSKLSTTVDAATTNNSNTNNNEHDNVNCSTNAHRRKRPQQRRSAAGPSSLSPAELKTLQSIPPSHLRPLHRYMHADNNDGTDNSKHDCVITPTQTRSLLLSLLDILFAYAYDHRTTGGEPTVESAWTVGILSVTFSWFDTCYGDDGDGSLEGGGLLWGGTGTPSSDDAILTALRHSIRRSLIYPYLRSYVLSRLIVNDVIRILKGGRRSVLKCLIQLRDIFENSLHHYPLNKLYVDPYLWWLTTYNTYNTSSTDGGRGGRWDVGGLLEEFGREVEGLVMGSAGVVGGDDGSDGDGDVLGKRYLGLDLIRIEEEARDELEDESYSSSSYSDDSDDDDDDDDDDSDSDDNAEQSTELENGRLSEGEGREGSQAAAAAPATAARTARSSDLLKFGQLPPHGPNDDDNDEEKETILAAAPNVGNGGGERTDDGIHRKPLIQVISTGEE